VSSDDKVPEKPRILFKYRGDNEYTERLVFRREIFLATANQLNDPFECTLQDLSREWVTEQVRQAMQAAIAGFVISSRNAVEPGGRFFGLSRAKAEREVARILGAGSLNNVYDAMRSFIRKRSGRPPSDCRTLLARFDDQLLQTGIFSLSAIPDHPLMWAHYGDDHRGVCFGFAIDEGSKLEDPKHCFPVIYSDELPTMDANGPKVTLELRASGGGVVSTQRVAFDDPTYQRVVNTKPTAWSYENEFRYIEETGGARPWPGRLAECTFGIRCTDERRQHYVALLKKHAVGEVMLFEMRKVRGSNRLERFPLDPPSVLGAHVEVAIPDTASADRRLNDGKKVEHEAFVSRMQSLLLAKNFDEIIAQTEHNLHRNPDNPMLHALKAQAHGFAGDHEIAAMHFRRVTEILPDEADGWYGFATALLQSGRSAEALVASRRAYKLAPDDPSHALNLGVLLVDHTDSVAEGLACLRHADRLGHRRAGRIIKEIESGERFA
jgi:tetratricopeptide (TPR) repeat protein